jgi:hypothetical protein
MPIYEMRSKMLARMALGGIASGNFEKNTIVLFV